MDDGKLPNHLLNYSGFGSRPHDETSFRERPTRGIAPHFLRPKGPAITKEFLTEAEVRDADPFNFDQGLTGRYDETRHHATHPLTSRRRGSNPVGLFKGMPRPPAFPHVHEQNVARYGEAQWEGSAYCKSCQSWVPQEEIVDNPQPADRYAEPVCSLCAEEIKRSLPKCPACGNFCSSHECADRGFPRCDRCGREGCDCLNFQHVPHTFGAWMDEEYDSWDTVCGDCYKRTEEEHDRRRAEELERSNEESMNTESTNKQMEE